MVNKNNRKGQLHFMSSARWNRAFSFALMSQQEASIFHKLIGLFNTILPLISGSISIELVEHAGATMPLEKPCSSWLKKKEGIWNICFKQKSTSTSMSSMKANWKKFNKISNCWSPRTIICIPKLLVPSNHTCMLIQHTPLNKFSTCMHWIWNQCAEVSE